MDYTSGDEGAPSGESRGLATSGESQGLATSGIPWAEDEESEGQKPESLQGNTTYEEALTQVKSFLASLVDPQGYPITMEEPVRTTGRRMTSPISR